MKTKNFLSTNVKLRRDNIFSWGIPAYRSATGKLTCPGAKDCLKGCYARQGFYVMPSVAKAQEARLALAESADFVATIDAEIKRRKIAKLRIHDSGDFYSTKYLRAWLGIIAKNPAVKFYAYTKMIPLFQGLALPENFKIIYSYGGKFDAMIKPKVDRHSAIFPSVEALSAAGYVDAHTFDRNATGENHRIGLVYHGHASRAFVAGGAA